MADLIGRKLGLPSYQINPGTWGKLLRSEEPAVESITARTADLVSLPEAFYARDRRVYYRWPRRNIILLLCMCGLTFGGAALALSPLNGWFDWLGWSCSITGALAYLYFVHSILSVTKR